MRSYFIFDIKQIDFAWVYLYVVLLIFRLFQVLLYGKFGVVTLLCKGIKGVSDQHHQHQELPDRMFQK
jgi:hypothetical protein